MKKLSLVVVLFTLAHLLVSCAPGDNSAGVPPKITELRGQWVVINYWAKWCKPCIKEIPELNELNSKYKQVTVLSVNYDGATGVELATQIENLGIEFAILPSDPAASLNLPRPLVLPTTVILNPSGEVSHTLIGPQTALSLATVTEQAL